MLPLRRLLTALVLILCASFAHAQAYTSIVVLGDSLTDTGNDTHVSTATYGPAAAVPAPVTGYTQGRFTDGIDTTPPASLYKGVWIEQLAAMLAAKPPVLNSLDGGSNYAYGFAFTGAGTMPFTYGPGNALSFPVNNMGLQLATYLATKPVITNKTLFVVWGGANDLLNATSSADISTAVTNEVGIVQQLITAGATDILIPNLPPLGAIPRLKGAGATATSLTAAAAAFNQGLAGAITSLPAAFPTRSLHLYQLDVFSLFNGIIAAPSASGFANVTDSSQLAAVNPDTYLFWDGLHPTTAGHHMLALNALNLLSPLTTTTSLKSSALAANLGAAVTFTATVSATSGIPAGTVTFFSDGTALGNAQLSGTATNTATYTTSTLTAGSHLITASYTASQYFNSSVSNTLTEVVTAPAILPTLTPVGLTIASGSTGTENISVASAGGFSGTVALGCGPLPATITCSFSPSSLVFAGANNTLTSTLTINTAGATARNLAPTRPGSRMLETVAACSLLPFFGFLAFRRKASRSLVLFSLFLVLSLGAVTGLSGCGNGATGAQTGNYAIPVTFTGGGVSTTVSFQLTVTK